MTIKKQFGKIEKIETSVSPVTRPIRKVRIRRIDFFERFFVLISSYFPNLKNDITTSGLKITPQDFARMVVKNTVTYSLITIVLSFLILILLKTTYLWLLPIFIISIIFYFNVWMYYPKVKAKQRERNIDKDMVFAGRHLIIALRSGVPLFQAMVGITRDYGEVSKEFNKIVERITLGEPPVQAIRNVMKYNPSKFFNRMSLQIINVLNSGANMASSLDSAMNQISQEQIISLKEYGQKLNPLSMFYMLFAIVFPSLGVVFITILISFTGGGLANMGVGILFLAGVYIFSIQIIFISMIESSRPPYEFT